MIEATKCGNDELIKALSIIGVDKIVKEEEEVDLMLTEEDIVAGDKLLNAVKSWKASKHCMLREQTLSM